MFTPSSSLLSLMLIGSLSLSQAAAGNTTDGPPATDAPQCAANCMSIKITEAATWFGPGDVKTYCRHPEFLDAYHKCLVDHCQGNDITAGEQHGKQTCAGVTPIAGGAPIPGGAPANPNDPKSPDDPKNATAHPPLSAPAGTPENSTLTASKNGTSLNTPNNSAANLNGALPTTTPTNSNSPSNNANNGTRFPGAVGSAAANASSQAGAAAATSYSSAILLTAFSSCLLSLVI